MLDELCRISISRFYRDRGVFDHVAHHLLPAIAKRATAQGRQEARAWSCGCASGEEPYSLAIAWRLSNAPPLPLAIVATDADPTLIDRARAATYPRSSMKDAPRTWLDAAFTRDGDRFRLKDAFREGITFLRQDIRTEQPLGPFDLILADPPYRDDPGLARLGNALSEVRAHSMLTLGGLFVYELAGAGEGSFPGWRLVRSRKYGRTRVLVFTRQAETGEASE